MEFSYIKLNAKKRLVKNHFKCFLISFFPYVTIFLLTALNYYLYIFLKGTSLDFSPLISSYAMYVKTTIMTVSIILSLILWQIARFLSESYFFGVYEKKKSRITIRQTATWLMVSLLKLLLTFAWSFFYLLPSLLVGGTLIYATESQEYGFNVVLTLFVGTIMLFVTGVGFLFVTLKRYSMCSFVILHNMSRDSLGVIEKSIELMEGNSQKYALFSLSLSGWVLSCLLIVPVFYVLPYIKLTKYSYFNAVTKPKLQYTQAQKPIIFYFPPKNKQYRF